MSIPLNPDGTLALVSVYPPGYPPAPPGYLYQSPDPACHSPNCGGQGACWVLSVPKTVAPEQFAHDMTNWARRLSQGVMGAWDKTISSEPTCAAGCGFPVAHAGRICGECQAAREGEAR